ncbi:unnamed protein product [Mytilus edulis]|uniref:DZIP3-like HEPN domain-containing protein n=1 Tax=Mytilus edulis TaxID=6550 RepID=A0A8S3SEL1_MYTED|nr:unnamed protein product [Mytilus edulis]
MDKEDKRRYFVVGSVYLEVVTPLFQQKLDENYKSLNFKCLKDFLDNTAVLHTLFHLRHRNAWCCTDKANCRSHGALPLNHHQWKQLYAENPGPGIHNCFCKYTAKSVEPEDLDVSLCGLILFNCCNLGPLDQEAVSILRRNKNDYLSHNTTCGITKDEYGPLMDELKTNILQLDQTKEDELIRIQKRPLDDALCNKYMTTLLNIHEILEKIDTNTTKTLHCVQQIWQHLTTQSLTKQGLEEKTGKQGNHKHPIKPYKLGQSIFIVHHQTDLSSVIGGDWSSKVSDIVMMDDGRLVICLPDQSRLLISNTDGSQVDSIPVQDTPCSVTAVNNSTVAVPLLYNGCGGRIGITTINNKLVVGGENRLLIIDHQTGEVVQTIQADCDPARLHGSGDRIFYSDINNNNLYWYSYTDDRHHTRTLPSRPTSMTSLQDGSLMDKEDKKRYFVVGSVYLEVVTPLFQQKLDENYRSLNFVCLKDFLDNTAVLHTLFHLRHRNARCCTDKTNCRSHGALPLNHHQWKQLYAENPGPGIHNCFCKYTAKSVKPEDLDLSLCGLILFNCCNLGPLELEAVSILRRNKNDYLSHNTTCGITKDEYGPLMDELKTNILQLDQTKEDELIRIQNRPLDDALCNKYMTTLLDIHEILEKIDTHTTETLCCVQQIWHHLTTQIFTKESLEENTDTQDTHIYSIKPYKLGQSIFTLHRNIDLTSVVGNALTSFITHCLKPVVGYYSVVTDMVMMDDGRLVMCLPLQKRLLIYNTYGSQVDSLHVRGGPSKVIAVNNSTVAVTLYGSKCIEIYDMNNKLKLKLIAVPEIMWNGITTINNKLVVNGHKSLLMIDYHTGEVVQTIQTDRQPYRLHGSGDRLFYCDIDYNDNKKLYWYSYTHDRHHTLTLPSPHRSMTTLQDGSLYVVCKDGSVQHVSSDCKQYKPVTTLQSTPVVEGIHYSLVQRKLVIRHTHFVTVFK